MRHHKTNNGYKNDDKQMTNQQAKKGGRERRELGTKYGEKKSLGLRVRKEKRKRS